jgi:hypothetical protein
LKAVEPLPLFVSLSVEVDAATREEEAARAELLESLKASLLGAFRDINAFSTVEPVGGVHEEEASDLVIRAVASRSEGGDSEPRLQEGMAALSVLGWLTTGVLGWLVPDTTFQPDFKVVLAVERPGVIEDTSTKLLTPGPADLSFWQRSYAAEFAYQLLVPPPFVPRDEETTRKRLTAIWIDDIHLKAAYYAKRELPLRQVESYAPFLLRGSAGDGGDAYLLFARNTVDHLRVNGTLPRLVEDGSSLRGFMEVNRLKRPEEREESFGALRSHLRAAVQGDPELRERVPGIEALLRNYTHVYRFGADSLQDSTGEPPRRLEVALEESESRFSWTMPVPHGQKGGES